MEPEDTEAIKQRIETNRLKALERRQQRLVAHPYSKTSPNDPKVYSHKIQVQGQKVIDTGGGFLIEESERPHDDFEELMFQIPDDPLDEDEQPECEECSKKFACSHLYTTFKYPVCDWCYDRETKHTLITRTEAKKEYLLKDCDLDKREPILKFVERKNPHNQRWGTMKLYLQVQIEERALAVWGSEENLQKELEKRDEKRIETKTKKYRKEMKQLKMNVRSSLFDRTSAAAHVHVYGDEEQVDEDTYKHKCNECGFEEMFEKM